MQWCEHFQQFRFHVNIMRNVILSEIILGFYILPNINFFKNLKRRSAFPLQTLSTDPLSSVILTLHLPRSSKAQTGISSKTVLWIFIVSPKATSSRRAWSEKSNIKRGFIFKNFLPPWNILLHFICNNENCHSVPMSFTNWDLLFDKLFRIVLSG